MDKSASCWESGLAMYFLHRELTGYEYGWRPPRQHQPLKRRRVPARIKFFASLQPLAHLPASRHRVAG
jgi:hypothetical protein